MDGNSSSQGPVQKLSDSESDSNLDSDDGRQKYITFHEASLGNFFEIYEYIKNPNANINATTNLKGKTISLLHAAITVPSSVKEDHVRIAKAILRRKDFNQDFTSHVLWCLCKKPSKSPEALSLILETPKVCVNLLYDDSTPLYNILSTLGDAEHVDKNVKALLQHKNMDINFSWGKKGPVINRLLRYGQYEGFKYLIKNSSCDLNVSTDFGTPLSVAIENCDPENDPESVTCLNLLLTHERVDVNKGSSEFVPLYSALQRPYTEMILLPLLSHPNIKINQTSSIGGYSALTCVCIYGPTVLENFLILIEDSRCDVNIASKSGTPLSILIQHDRFECFELLLQHYRVDVNKGSSEYSPLYCAVQSAHTEKFLRPLLSHPDIKVNETSSIGGEAVLSYVCKSGPNVLENVFILIEDSRCDVNISSKSGTPLYISIQHDRFECFELLLQHYRVDVNKGSSEYSPLFCAVQSAHTEKFLRPLLSHPDIKVNATSTVGGAALNNVCSMGPIVLENFQILINDRRCDVNVQSDVGTPLFILIDRTETNDNFFQAFQMLLAERPDIDTNCGLNSLSPLCRAVMKIQGKGDICDSMAVELLQNKKTDPNAECGEHGGTSLRYLVEKGLAFTNTARKLATTLNCKINDYNILFELIPTQFEFIS